MLHVRDRWWAPVVALGAVLVAADAGLAQPGTGSGQFQSGRGRTGRQQPFARNASGTNSRGGKGNCSARSLGTTGTTPQLSTGGPVTTTAGDPSTLGDSAATGTTQPLTARQRKLLLLRELQMQQAQLQQMQLQLAGGASR